MRAGHAPGREDASGGRAVAWLGTRAPRLGPRSLSAPRSPAPACQDAAAARPGRKAAAVPLSPALGLCDMKSSASSALPPAPVAVSLLLKFCNWLPLSRAMRKTCVFVFNKYANVHFHVQEFLIMTAEELEAVPADARGSRSRRWPAARSILRRRALTERPRRVSRRGGGGGGGCYGTSRPPPVTPLAPLALQRGSVGNPASLQSARGNDRRAGLRQHHAGRSARPKLLLRGTWNNNCPPVRLHEARARRISTDRVTHGSRTLRGSAAGPTSARRASSHRRGSGSQPWPVGGTRGLQEGWRTGGSRRQ